MAEDRQDAALSAHSLTAEQGISSFAAPSFAGLGAFSLNGGVYAARPPVSLADSRPFVKDGGLRRVPRWLEPRPDEEFLRYFGMIRLRKSGGLPGWVGENEICEANQALRFRAASAPSAPTMNG